MNQLATTKPALYVSEGGEYRKADPDLILDVARHIAPTRELPVLDSPQAIAKFAKTRAIGLDHERLDAYYVDTQMRVIAAEEVARGGPHSSQVPMGEVVKGALKLGASGVIVSHNHPAGNPEPSDADTIMTATLVNALSVVDLLFVDHVITGDGDSYFSFAEHSFPVDDISTAAMNYYQTEAQTKIFESLFRHQAKHAMDKIGKMLGLT